MSASMIIFTSLVGSLSQARQHPECHIGPSEALDQMADLYEVNIMAIRPTNNLLR